MKQEFKSLFSLLLEGHGVKTRWVAVFLLVILLISLFLLYDYLTSWTYYRELDTQLGILERLHSLSVQDIQEDSLLNIAYCNIVSRITSRPAESSVDKLSTNAPAIGLWKFLSGISVGLLILVGSLFTKKNRKSVVLGAIIMIVLFGSIGYSLPTLVHPLVNYSLLPLFQFALLIWLVKSKLVQSRNKTQAVLCRSTMRMISTSIDMHLKQGKHYPSSLEQAQKMIPLISSAKCPVCKSVYQYSFSDNSYKIQCPNTPSHGSITDGQRSW